MLAQISLPQPGKEERQEEGFSSGLARHGRDRLRARSLSQTRGEGVQSGLVRCRQDRTGSSVQAVPCRPDRTGSSVQAVPCRPDRTGSSVQAVPCRQDRTGSSVQAVPCRQDRTGSSVQAVSCRQDRTGRSVQVLRIGRARTDGATRGPQQNRHHHPYRQLPASVSPRPAPPGPGHGWIRGDGLTQNRFLRKIRVSMSFSRGRASRATSIADDSPASRRLCVRAVNAASSALAT